jgi:hypothetical protein
MAKTAVTKLAGHIKSARQEAYSEGYAAAMRAVVEFTSKPEARVTKATTTKATSALTAAPKQQRRMQAKATPRQARRSDNMGHIAEAMMSLPDHSGPAAVIKKALAGKGHEISYTSIRHGLGQLQARGQASAAADGKTWSYTGPAS